MRESAGLLEEWKPHDQAGSTDLGLIVPCCSVAPAALSYLALKYAMLGISSMKICGKTESRRG